MTVLARRLRINQTEAEKKLWHYLRAKQMSAAKFRRQQPVGPYIVDFVSFEKKLVIEIDGGQHAEELSRTQDEVRDGWLKQQGYTLLRFWNNEVLENIDGVWEVIRSRI